MPQKDEMSRFQARIVSGQPALIAEVCPPQTGDPDVMRAVARRFAGNVHALGVCDNRREVQMSALAAATLVAGEGVDPILHLTTRDRNRIALASDGLGASALGIRDVLCTSGTHQTLGRFRSARNVHDIDSVQLIQMYSNLSEDGALFGEVGLKGLRPFFVGGVATPFADPMEMQVSRLAKKVRAGAKFLVTQPVFDLDRFGTWWQEVTRRGLHETVAILAGVRVLTSLDEASAYAQCRPSARVPEALLKRLSAKTGPDEQRRVGIQIATETVGRLRVMAGLRGFDISADGDATVALAVIEAAGLRAD